MPPVEAKPVTPLATAAPPSLRGPSTGGGMALIAGGCLLFVGLFSTLILICGMLGWMLFDSTTETQLAQRPVEPVPWEPPAELSPEQLPLEEFPGPPSTTPVPQTPGAGPGAPDWPFPERPPEIAPPVATRPPKRRPPNKLSPEPKPPVEPARTKPVTPVEEDLPPLDLSRLRAPAQRSSDLRYQWERGKRYVCEYSIESDAPGAATVSYSGENVFTPGGLPKRGVNTNYDAAFVVHPQGVLITSAHVVDRAAQVKVFLNGEEHTAEVVETIPELDLAILKIEQDGLSHLALREPPLQPNESVWTFEYPVSAPFAGSPLFQKSTIGDYEVRGNDRLVYIRKRLNRSVASGSVVLDEQCRVAAFTNRLLAPPGQATSNLAPTSASLAEILTKRGIPFRQVAQDKDLHLPGGARQIQRAIGQVRARLLDPDEESPHHGLSYSGERTDNTRSTSNHESGLLVVTDQGRKTLTSMKDWSAYYCGDASLIGIESLPNFSQETWRTMYAYSYGFLPAIGGVEKAPAVITVTYRLLSETGDEARIEKHYVLTSLFGDPHKNPMLHVDLKGLLIWSKRDGMPLSLKMEGQSTVHYPGGTHAGVRPLTLEYTMRREDGNPELAVAPPISVSPPPVKPPVAESPAATKGLDLWRPNQ